MVELSITNIAGEPFDIFMLNFYVDFEIFFVMSFPTTQMADFISDGFFIMGNFNMGFQALFKETLFTKLALKNCNIFSLHTPILRANLVRRSTNPK